MTAITLKVEEDFLAYGDDGELSNRPMFCVTERRANPYYDENNYRCIEWSDPDILRADTLEALYEQMAQVRAQHTLRGEESCRTRSRLNVDDFKVEFSRIFVEVVSYDEKRLLDSDTYKRLGEARDKKHAAEKAENERIAEASRKRYLALEEEKDKREFERLKAKYGAQ